MDAKDFVTLAMLAAGGKMQGKTKLQKTVYFLGLITGCLRELGYHPHFYGPYSDEVDEAITTLKTIGAIDQNITDWGFDQSGFEVRRYDFRLNEQGQKYAELKARKNPELWEKIQSAVRKLNQAGDVDYMQMAIAAKTHFMLRQKHGPASMQELANLAPRFGWKVAPDQINRGARYLQNLGLVELS